MALIKADRVRESSTTTGTGAFTLSGAEATFRAFSAVCTTGDTFYYTIAHRTANEWETGLGTYSSANTLTRTTVHASSNSGAAVNFSAGTKEVFLALTARHLDRINDNGQSTAIGSKTSVVAVNDSATLPDLDLQFAELKTLTAKYGPTPSYSRASTGLYTNASGVLTSAAVNEPRFDHVYENGAWVSKGLLIEEQRTNSVIQSAVSITGWQAVYQCSVSSNIATSPLGTTTAASVVENTANDVHYHRQTISIGSGTYTASVYAKAGARYIVSFGGTATGRKYFNLQTGTVGSTAAGSPASASIVNAGNGWYRLTVTGPSYGGGTAEHIQIVLTNNTETETYTGDGTSGAFFWGAQIESGSFATSHIPTTSSSVVRSADVCQITGSAFTNLWNATEGSIVLEQDLLSYSDPAADQRYFAVAGSYNNPGLTLHYDGGTSFYWERYFNSASNLTLADVSSAYKVAIAVKSNDYATSLNGGAPITASSPALGTNFAKMDIGYQVGVTARSSWIQRLRYFRSRLDNTQLVNLSGGINTLAFKPLTGSGSVTVANEFSSINVSVPNPLPIANGGTGGTTAVSGAVNLIKSAPNDGAEYTLKSKQISGAPSFYWVDSTGYAPTLDLLFAADKSLTPYAGPTPSFSRASTGTYFNSSGVLTSAAINAPRFDHTYNGTSWVSRGLLVEEQRTNVCKYSEDLTQANWTKTQLSVSSNAIAAPDGNTTADKLVENTATAEHYLRQQFSGLASGSVVSFSAYFKQSGRTTVAFYGSDDVAKNYPVLFDLANGVVLGNLTSYGAYAAPLSSSITNVGNGWYRCTIVAQLDAGRTTASITVTLANTTSTSFTGSYTGDGTSGVYIWGAQAEVGSFATSLIPTTSASSTRSADVCQITGSDFSSFWNASEGAIVAEFDRIAIKSSEQEPFNVSNSSGNNSIALDLHPTDDYAMFWISAIQAKLQVGSALAANTTGRASIAYKINDFAMSFNGAAVVTDTSGSVPVPDRMGIGSNLASGLYHLNGHIARLRYYPTRLPNATLQTLST